MKMIEKKLCKKIIYNDISFPDTPKILYGLILWQDDNFLKFQTENREYTFSKKLLISIEDTNKEFRGNSNDEI